MYFEVENTPENIRRKRRAEPPRRESLDNERPELKLAPFSRPPQVVFKNVPIGINVQKKLDVVNPTEQIIQISLARPPPPGLYIFLPEGELILGPKETFELTLAWTPVQPTSARELLHFADKSRRRFEVILILQTQALKTTSKTKSNKTNSKCRKSPNNSKRIKSSPPKQSKKSSPTLLVKKQCLYNTSKGVRTETKRTYTEAPKTSQFNKENFAPSRNYDCFAESANNCPFDSPISIKSGESLHFATFDISELFPNKKTVKHDIENTAFRNDNLCITPLLQPKKEFQNILQSSNKLNFDLDDLQVDNLTYTPLKYLPPKNKFVNIDAVEFEDSLEKHPKPLNETHSIINEIQPVTERNHADWNIPHYNPSERTTDIFLSVDESALQSKKIPNTSSPKQYGSPGNFTINTECSRISNDFSFYPPRCSTDKKMQIGKGDLFAPILDHVDQATFTKTDSPQMILEVPVSYAKLPRNFPPPPEQSQKTRARQLNYNEIPPMLQLKRDRNNSESLQRVLEWNNRSPPRSISPLKSIPEEMTQLSESHFFNRSDKHTGTFTINRTFDKTGDISRRSIANQVWQKKSIRCEPELWKMPAPKDEPKETNFNIESNISVNNITSSGYPLIVSNVYEQASTADPFLSQGYYYDEEAVQKIEIEFKRWLNYILTPPSDLDCNSDELKFDVGKVWTETRNKEVPVAPTREQVCSRYHDSRRLESLRKSAAVLLSNESITKVLFKLYAQIDKKLIAIRNDRNMHMDVGLQKEILKLLLCYNPLWLRIGLEAIYGLVIPLTSNNDVNGLSSFIVTHMFKDANFKSKQSQANLPNMLNPAYKEHAKKFTLKKFFTLVFFLDQAKQKKLIAHDPCLFCRNAEYKESKELLFGFTRELIAGIGDITRHLRPLGYVVSHKQSYLDEFKYAVHNLAIDLRDGIRLTRVMEVILCKGGLMTNLRTPAISRLQKIYNVQVALGALKEAEFTIVGEITAKDIADGHREKTLSLLWQIIHEFRAPLFEKAANVIQIWWKKKYLRVVIKKRIKERKERNRHNAASIIQEWWRKIQYDRLAEKTKKQLEAASIVLQKYWRSWLCRSRFISYKKAVLKIELWYISTKEIRHAKAQISVLRKRMKLHNSATTIQRYIKAYQAMKIQRNSYLELKRVTINIQTQYRSILNMRKMRKEYLELKQKTIYIQNTYKAKIMMRKERKHFLKLKLGAVTIQSRYRALKAMTKFRNQYLRQKSACIMLQRFYRIYKLGKIQRAYYVNLKLATIFVQRKFRAKKLMENNKSDFMKLKKACLTMQRKYRANLLMKRTKIFYDRYKQTTISIQRRYKAKLLSKACKAEYNRKKNACIVMQRRFRAMRSMKIQRQAYLALRHATITIQTYYRAKKLKDVNVMKYRKLRTAVINVQWRYRANKQMLQEREYYKRLIRSTITIQRRFIAKRLMEHYRNEFLKLKRACLTVQRKYRANLLMKQNKIAYNQYKRVTILIQTRFKAKLLRRTCKAEYDSKRNACIVLQKRFRAMRSMKIQRNSYVALRHAAITIQTYYRAKKLKDVNVVKYRKLRTAVINVQRRYRANKQMLQEREYYKRLIHSIITIQRRFVAKRLMEHNRSEFLKLKRACLTVQRKCRANLLMKQSKIAYDQYRQVTILIQTRFKAKLLRRTCMAEYDSKRNACIVLQRRFRAMRSMKIQRNSYVALRHATITIQTYYRAKKLRDVNVLKYLKLRTAVINVQRRYRANKQMIQQREYYKRLVDSTTAIQRLYRANRLMEIQRREFSSVKSSVITIQRKYKAIRLSRDARHAYLRQKTAANIIKSWYKSTKNMKKIRQSFKEKLRAIRVIQEQYRAWKLMKSARLDFLEQKEAALMIQTQYRAYRNGKRQEAIYRQIITSTITIQTWYRSILEIRKYQAQYALLKHEKRCHDAAKKIQCWYHYTTLARRERKRYLTLRRAAIAVQKEYRMLVVRKSYTEIRYSVVCIQRYYRSYRLMREQKAKFFEYRSRIIKIQSYIRRYLLRKQFKKQVAAIRTIQRSYRRFKLQQNLQKQLKIQSEAAICLQKNIRKYIVARLYDSLKKSAILVQKRYRATAIARDHRAIYLMRRAAIIKVQALARGYLTRRKIERMREELQVRRANEKINHAATVIQSAWRGHHTRSLAQAHNKRVADLRRRWREGALHSKQATLGERNADALLVISDMRDIASIIRAFNTFQFLTEVCPMQYHETAKKVANGLFRYIMASNRSVPCMETIRLAGAILVNLARYEHTALQIYHRLQVVHLIKFMMRWCGDTQLFCTFATYLWLFHKYQHIKKDLTKLLHESENYKIMDRIRTDAYRNKRMADNLLKTKAVFNRTPARSKSVELVLPILEPDYGIQRQDRPRYFINEAHAIDALFQTYNLK